MSKVLATTRVSRIAAFAGLAAIGFGLAMPASADDGTVKIGIAAPFTGSSAPWGEQFKRGTDMAVKDFNAAGGAAGQQLSVEIGDDMADPKAGVSVANKFVADGVKWVIGHVNSGVSIPASDIYAENGIIQITPASTDPTFTDRGLWNTFRTTGRDDQQGSVAAAYLMKHFAGKRIAIVHDKTPFGEGLAQIVKKGINEKGLTEVFYEGINIGEKDYSSLVTKLKGAGADIIYYGGVYTEAGLIIRQMRDQGMQVPLMSGDGLVTTDFGAIVGPGGAGTLMTYTPDPRDIPEAKKIVERMRAEGFEPEAFTVKCYASVQILVQAANAIQSTDPEKIAEYMHSGHVFDTVIGKISYDQHGDMVQADYVMYVWKPTPSGGLDYAGNELTD